MTYFRTILTRSLEWLTVGVFAILVVNVLWGVLTRYALGDQARWSEELARLLMVWLVFLGAVLSLVQNEHLGVNILVQKLHPDIQPIATVCVQLVVLIFSAVVLTYGGVELTLQRWDAGQSLPALGISKAWFYLAIPISGLLMTLASLDLLIASLRRSLKVNETSRSEAPR